MTPRLTPYTALGIRRVRCAYQGCRRLSFAQWKVCADATYLPLCWRHDIELNELVLMFVGDRQARRKSAHYAAAVIRVVNARKVA